MKKTTRLALIALLAALLLASSVVLISCSGRSDALNNYMLDEDGKTVSADFVLPGSIGPFKTDKDGVELAERQYKVKWTSSNTDAISISKQADGIDYDAHVTLGNKVEEVTLTLKLGTSKKTFTVRVAALDATTFADAYVFPYDRKTVSKDFTLDSFTQEIQGQKASISWAVGNDDSKPYLTVDGHTCKVTQSGMNPSVRLRATFSFTNSDGETSTATMPYRFNVYVDMDDEMTIDYWYTNTGVSVDLEGYVVAIAENDSNYSNVTFYMADKSWNAGYYIFRGGADDACHQALRVGAYVTVTGTTNTNYSGLIETNAGGKVVVDESKSVSESVVMQHVYDIENDLLGDVPATIYHESQLVRLTGWTLTSVGKPTGSSNSETLMTLKKGEKTINVQMSGYMKGHYSIAADKTTKEHDPAWQAIVDKAQAATANSTVDIIGVLGNYNGSFQILAVKADWITFTDPVEAQEPFLAAEDPSNGGTFKLAMYQANLGKWLYANGNKSGNYLATTDDSSQAAEFTITKSDSGYTIQVGGQFVEKGSSSSALALNATQTSNMFWKWDSELGVFTWTTADSKIYYMGTYNSFDTISVSETFRISGDNAGAVGTSQFVARFGDLNPDYVAPVDPVYPGVEVAAAIKAVHDKLAANSIAKLNGNKISGRYIVASDVSFSLPLSVGDVKISYRELWKNQFVTFGDLAENATEQSIAIHPGTLHERMMVRVEYTYGTGADAYTTFEYFSIETFERNAQQIVDEEIAYLLVPVTLKQGQTLTLPSAGSYYAGVTMTWALDNTYEGIEISQTNGKLSISWVAPGEVTIKLSVVVALSDATATKDWNVEIPKLMEIIDDVEIDWLERFATFDKENDWTSSYTSHTVPVGADLEVVFSRADSQSATITDRPVIAANASNTAYVTLTLTGGGKQIDSVSFELMQWNTKTFQDMYIQYKLDGETEWKDVEGVGFKGKGEDKKTDDNAYVNIGDFEKALSANDLPDGVVAVRLVLGSKESSNVQVGLTTTKLHVSLNSDIGNGGGSGDSGNTGGDTTENKYGTAESPLTVAQALALGAEECGTTNQASTSQIVFVKGKVITAVDNSGSYINSPTTIQDLTDTGSTIVIRTLNKTTGVDDPDQNDTIVISGYIRYYTDSGLVFASNGSTYCYMVANTRGDSTITLGDHDHATVTGFDGTTATVKNGQTFSFTVAAESDEYQIAAVKQNGKVIDPVSAGNYTITVHGNSEITVETAGAGEKVAQKIATITFGNTSSDLQAGATAQKVEYKNGVVTFTNDKASSSSDLVTTQASEHRIYAKSTFTITSETAFVKLVITCTNSSASNTKSYIESWLSSASASGTVTVDGDIVTVELDDAISTLGAVTATAQIRFASLEVYAFVD